MGNKKKLGLSLIFAMLVVAAPASFAQEATSGEALASLQWLGSFWDSILEALWISPTEGGVAPSADPSNQPEGGPMIIPSG